MGLNLELRLRRRVSVFARGGSSFGEALLVTLLVPVFARWGGFLFNRGQERQHLRPCVCLSKLFISPFSPHKRTWETPLGIVHTLLEFSLPFRALRYSYSSARSFAISGPKR